MSGEPLDALLRIALEEGTLTPETLPEFVRGLRERAALVLQERVAGLEEHVANLEREVGWRGAEQQRLEGEIAWRKGSLAELETKVAWLEGEVAAARQLLEATEQLLEATKQRLESASSAHDRLLDHHRALIGEVVAQLEQLGAAPAWRWLRVRRMLRELAASLRQGLP